MNSPDENHQRQRDNGSLPPGLPRRKREDRTLRTMTFEIGRKTFTISLRENYKGRFVRITEMTRRGVSAIIIPYTGLDHFQQMFESIRAGDRDRGSRRSGGGDGLRDPGENSGHRSSHGKAAGVR